MTHYRATINNPVVSAVEVELANATSIQQHNRVLRDGRCRMGQTMACVIHRDDGTVGPTMSETGSDPLPRLGRHVS